MKLFGRAILGVCLVTAAACGDSTSIGPVVYDASGTWRQANTVPGSSEYWSLSVKSGVVSGSGTWTGEACCGGNITISGTQVGDSLHLDLVYAKTTPAPVVDPYYTWHIDGVLQSATDFVGRATSVSSGGTVHFQKLGLD